MFNTDTEQLSQKLGNPGLPDSYLVSPAPRHPAKNLCDGLQAPAVNIKGPSK